jgi:large-conductance mechanosensitive channel
MSSFLEKTTSKLNPFSSLGMFYNSPTTTIITLSASVAMGGAFKECVQAIVSGILQPLVNMLISLTDINYINKKNTSLQISNVVVTFITFAFTVLLIKVYVGFFYDSKLQEKLIVK